MGPMEQSRESFRVILPAVLLTTVLVVTSAYIVARFPSSMPPSTNQWPTQHL
jgi:hypothetical protein